MNHSLSIFSAKVRDRPFSVLLMLTLVQGEVIANLYDPRRVTAVQAVTCAHPNIVERAVSGNASGRCVLWAPDDL